MTFVKSPIFYILVVMFALMLGSVWHDSATMDELAHIPAGFGYVTQLDGRLNPEHPPLLKILSALSGEIFVRPYFPTNTPAWQEYINGQWDQGRVFLYESGNNANSIIFWSRLPIILLTLLLGILLWCWTYKRFGSLTALFTLTFFAFSPTILAHSHYVTTDIGAALGFFIGFIAFLQFVETPSWKNVFTAGIIFGIAELLKFSLILLLPLYGIMLVAWVVVRPHLHFHDRVRDFFGLLGKTIAVGVIGIAVIWITYVPLVFHYPLEKQLADAEFILGSYPSKTLVALDLALIQTSATRPLGQYFLGFLMVTQRAGGGNTGYFLGEVSAAGSHIYFPTLYLFKESLPFHILTFIALWVGFLHVRNNRNKKDWMLRVRAWTYHHFAEFSALVFIAIYWASSVISPLNIGVRHVLPTFPFIYFLVAKKLAEWLEMHKTANPQNMVEVIKEFILRFIKSIPKYGVMLILMLWLILGTIISYPHFLSFYNELAGGTANGYNIAVDSNYDWGQDLLRLRDYVEENKIEKIGIDYFGGGNLLYYFGDRFVPWSSAKGPIHGWLAVSATFLQSAQGTTAPGFNRGANEEYSWLREYQPVARAGYSMFIYKLP